MPKRPRRDRIWLPARANERGANMADARIHGKLIDASTSAPLAELRIEAWSADRRFKHPLGASASDTEGAFEIPVAPHGTDVYFRIYHGHELLLDTKADGELWNEHRAK